MKKLVFLFFILFGLTAGASEREKLNQLLQDKGTSIPVLESQGMRLILGERTGGGRSILFSNVEVLFTKEEAILKKEIQSAKLVNGSKLGHLEYVQASGRHIDAQEIIGIIAK